MLVDVPRCFCHRLGMELTDAHRQSLADVFRVMRRGRFLDNKKDAYTAAGVNSATWERLERGLPVKPQTLSKVLARLIPETGGDWTRLHWEDVELPALSADAIVTPTLQDAHLYVEAPGERVESGVSNEDLLREIVRSRAESDQIRAAVDALSKRVEKLEERGS